MSAAISLIATVAVFGLLASGLALGQMFGRTPIKGSCGGLACLKAGPCEGCPHHDGEST